MSKLKDCNCIHVPKKHKLTGRCRGDCECDAAQRKAARKR